MVVAESFDATHKEVHENSKIEIGPISEWIHGFAFVLCAQPVSINVHDSADHHELPVLWEENHTFSQISGSNWSDQWHGVGKDQVEKDHDVDSVPVDMGEVVWSKDGPEERRDDHVETDGHFWANHGSCLEVLVLRSLELEDYSK